MIWFYFCVAVLLVLSGAIIFFKAAWFKSLLQFVIQKDLFLILGVFEITIGLGTLYFRDLTHMTWFVYLAGLLMFLDGILSVLMSRRLREMYEWFINTEDRQMRSYAVFLFLLSLGYFFAAIR
ncbi:MAG TPA: hypothetical protein P5268_09895 [Candidatus Marinimicrobia bacterium]|nr:hypothetical protein [Candidatus Neomarinimicrobiota bacterium]HRS51633.1 hypothetical protein [Candidatus Neomarinimicrobiota bacterium]HRU93324.1 hypothetical protein [Candidatus Neomarinimicrobiota bacterium]